MPKGHPKPAPPSWALLTTSSYEALCPHVQGTRRWNCEGPGSFKSLVNLCSIKAQRPLSQAPGASYWLALSPAGSPWPQYRASDPWLGTALEQLYASGSTSEARGNKPLALAGCQGQASLKEGVPHSQETPPAAPQWGLAKSYAKRKPGRERKGRSQVIVLESRGLVPWEPHHHLSFVPGISVF